VLEYFKSGSKCCQHLANATENFAVWFFDYVHKELYFLCLRCWDTNVSE
jgi:hypothetical protein